MGHDRPASPARGSQGADRPPRSAGLGAHRWSPSSGGGGRPAWAPRLPTWPCLSCHPGLAGHPTPQWGLGSGSRDTARPTHLCNTHARAPACTHLFSQSHWHAHTLTLILAGAHTAEALGSSLPPHCWARCAVGGGGHRLQKLPVPSTHRACGSLWSTPGCPSSLPCPLCSRAEEPPRLWEPRCEFFGGRHLGPGAWATLTGPPRGTRCVPGLRVVQQRPWSGGGLRHRRHRLGPVATAAPGVYGPSSPAGGPQGDLRVWGRTHVLATLSPPPPGDPPSTGLAEPPAWGLDGAWLGPSMGGPVSVHWGGDQWLRGHCPGWQCCDRDA